MLGTNVNEFGSGILSIEQRGALDVSFQPVNASKMFLNAEEAAHRLGVTVGWIYERTRRKLIPHRKLGKFIRFTESDLQAISDAAATGSVQ
jgi:excisionase family DNA binding protein